MRSPKDMPEQMPVTAASLKHDAERSPDPWEVEKARLTALTEQVTLVYRQMRGVSSDDAIGLTELVLNRFDDGVRP